MFSLVRCCCWCLPGLQALIRAGTTGPLAWRSRAGGHRCPHPLWQHAAAGQHPCGHAGGCSRVRVVQSAGFLSACCPSSYPSAQTASSLQAVVQLQAAPSLHPPSLRCPSWSLPPLLQIHNVELRPGGGGQLARAAGTSCTLIKKGRRWRCLRLALFVRRPPLLVACGVVWPAKQRGCLPSGLPGVWPEGLWASLAVLLLYPGSCKPAWQQDTPYFGCLPLLLQARMGTAWCVCPLASSA